MPRPTTPACLVALCALCCTGCSLNEMMASGMGRMAVEAAPDLAAHWDAELVLDGVPGGILQLEAMRSISPDSRGLNLELARAYIAYGYGRIELDIEQHLAADEKDEAARDRARAQRVYERAREIGVAAMAGHDDGIYSAIDDGPEALSGYLRQAYTEAEDLDPLYWTALAWGSWALVSDTPEMVTEEARMARRMAERVVAVDAGYRQGGALSLLGRLACTPVLSESGAADRGREHFERALELTSRKAHMVQMHYARSCVVGAGERDLYVELMREILQAPDQGNAVRMANKVARARAEWYLPRTGADF